MLAVHAASLALAAPHRSRPAAGGDGEPCDPRQCRLVVNDLKRTIERLRRGFDCIDLCGTARRGCAIGEADARGDRWSAPAPAAPAARKAYAPDPLGKPTPAPELPPPPPPRFIFLDSVYRITNVGTLLDVLA
ncbi:MAG: hypothetical protein SYC29_11005 [Planctomycetota bacterium]|nr:hypothetical protein [Planctomycetota bacterium]